MELSLLQKELMAALAEKGLRREDILSVMLVLTREEKVRAMLSFLSENTVLTVDEIFRKAGSLAFPQN
ncbi:MAG: hypothetical protein IJC84_03780 [Clostridia bacterium]|nr:hypothetical protein [Clostridia bacterium]